MVAVLMEKAEHCASCGLAERDWHEDPGSHVAMQVVCPWCALKDRVRSDGDTDASIPGASVRLVSAATAKKMTSTAPQRPKSLRERAKER